VIASLLPLYEIDILTIGEMSDKSPWVGNLDLRQTFYDFARSRCRRMVSGMSREDTLIYHDDGKRLLAKIDLTDYDLIILDDNLCKKSWGFQGIFRYVKTNSNIPIIGFPHGNRELSEKFIRGNVGSAYDKCFVFGKQELLYYGKHTSKSNLIPGGIPSNDILGKLELDPKYILMIVGFVKGIKTQKGYSAFTEQTFLKSGVLSLQEQYNCPIIIKEKSTFVKGSKSLSSLERYDGVSVVMDVANDNDLIRKAKIVIAAPSTLCFKPIQLGIPTALLKGYGMLGNFHNFIGTVNCKKTEVLQTIQLQMEAGKQIDWIQQTIEGGLNFKSTEICVSAIKDSMLV
jgi:hypothetical protein